MNVLINNAGVMQIDNLAAPVDEELLASTLGTLDRPDPHDGRARRASETAERRDDHQCVTPAGA
ncbi:hypothetical protein [Paraburkholderia terrae]